jgi:site-specific recombinase XerD
VQAMNMPAIIATDHAVPILPPADVELAADFARAEKSEATRRAYRGDFDAFRVWCTALGVSPLPATAETVAAFLAAEARRGLKPSSIGRRLAAVRYAHKLAGHEPPTSSEAVRATMRGIRRTVGTAPVRKAPLTADHARAMASAAPDTLCGLRDRAVLLLGFAGAFRRSELVALDVADVESCDEGLRIHIRRSKTDQEGQGATIAILRGSMACPVHALQAWLAAAAITEGPLFRPVAKGGRVETARLSDRSVAEIVKRHARMIGLDPAAYAGHSLRAGFLTSAAARGASIFKMMDVSRHKSVDTLRGYVRDAELFRDHAGAGLL